MDHSGHLTMEYLIERHSSNDTGNSDAVASSDHHCSPLAGDIARYDPIWITPPGVVAPNPQDHALSTLEDVSLEPHPPDRSVFQVFLN
jgi:hypothetical protein